MKTIAQEASAILGVRVEPKHWKEAFNRLDRLGYPTRKMVNDLVMMLCERLEMYETAYGDTTDTKHATKSPIQPTHD